MIGCRNGGKRSFRVSLIGATAPAWFFISAGAAGAQIPRAPVQSPVAGAAVFGEKGCAVCHAVTGDGESLGPDLYAASHERSFSDLAAAMWNHLPEMSERMATLGIQRPRLNPQETGDLIAYLYSLDYFAPPGDPGRGRELFAAKRCRMCHQVGGVGGVVGPPLDHVGGHGVPIEIATAMWNHGPEMLEALQARNIERPALTESELVDLIAFLDDAAGLRRSGSVHAVPGAVDAGELVLEEKGCIECHGTAGGGGRIAPDLADRARSGGLTGFMTAMWNKMPEMTSKMDATEMAFPVLTPDEMANLVAYLSSIGYFGTRGNARRGRALVNGKNCLDCHTLGERGTGTAGDLQEGRNLTQPASVVAAMWNHVLVLDAMSASNRLSPLSGDEMADVIAFFEQASR